MAYMFPDNMCPSSRSSIPFTMKLPENLPQSVNYMNKICIYYNFQAQVVPVYTSDVTDKFGGCKLRSSRCIWVSPVRPIISAPMFNNQLTI